MTVKENSMFWPNFGVAFLVRALFYASTIWIVIMCVERGNSLITMHIFWSTLGCGLLMIDATLVVSGDPILSSKVSRKNRITIHWILHTLGLIALAVGFGHVLVFKVRAGLDHFNSIHGIVGLVGYLLPFFVGITAIPTVCTKLLPSCISLACYKYVHVYLSIIAYVMLWAGQVTGFYRRSWNGSEVGTNLTIAAYAVGGFFLLAKPLYSTLSRNFCSKI